MASAWITLVLFISLICGTLQTGKKLSAPQLKSQPRQHAVFEHYRPTSETPFDWRFAGGPMMTRFYMHILIGNRTIGPAKDFLIVKL